MPVLLCYDGSPSAKHALSVAHLTLGDEPVTLLHVWNPAESVLADAFSTEDVGIPSTDELDRLASRRAGEIANEGEELARRLGFGVSPRVERNDSAVWRTILDVADEIDAELIVIGTHGRTAVQPALLGSVSNAVVHNSTRPVLVVPAAPQAAQGNPR